MEADLTSQFNAWNEQFMQDDRFDRYLIESCNWEPPKIEKYEINLSEEESFESILDLNLKDQDFKFGMDLHQAKPQAHCPFNLEKEYPTMSVQMKKQQTNMDVSSFVNHSQVGENEEHESERRVTHSKLRSVSDASVTKAHDSCDNSHKDSDDDTNSEHAVFQINIDELPKEDSNSATEIELNKADEDADSCYKAPKTQKYEYNKRKDVILKTILRKCRRTLQDKFNDMTGYFPSRKLKGPQFLKDCIVEFHKTFCDVPEQLDLVFYLGSMLYPQEMMRGVDCFFESEINERVKLRKIYRAKIQKVHDVLYRYSHEKFSYFTTIPELCYIYALFYKEEITKTEEDMFFMNGAAEIYEKCFSTLTAAGVSL